MSILNLIKSVGREIECSSGQRNNKQTIGWKGEHLSYFRDSFLPRQPVVLEWYRSMEDKKRLLHEAILTHDGNTIITVILFIQKTLSKGEGRIVEEKQ